MGVEDEDDELLRPHEVAELFGVHPRTITRWAKQGKLRPIRTLGGHRRYRESEVRELHREERGEEDGDRGGDPAGPG